MGTNYNERLILPVDGYNDISFYTKSGTLIAKGYVRVEVGGRGPYIEFTTDQLIKDAICVPDKETWRLSNRVAFYNEYRSNDEAFVKFYFQKRKVSYANYKLGFWYASVFDLVSDLYPVLVKPLESK